MQEESHDREPHGTTDAGVVVVRPEGRLNMTVAPALREQLHGLVREGKARLVVDLSAVDAIDSSGLGALISGLKAARQGMATCGSQPRASRSRRSWN